MISEGERVAGHVHQLSAEPPEDCARPAAEQSHGGSVANIMTTRVSILLSLQSLPQGVRLTYKLNTYFPVSTTHLPPKS